MHWFRSTLRLNAWLAVLALAVQLALAFGHVDDPLIAAAAGPTSFAAQPGGSPVSPGHHPGNGADGSCPICAFIQLASVSSPSVAPALPFPTAAVWTRVEAVAEPHVAAAPRRSFQARAPPRA